MQTLAEVVQKGCPETCNEVPFSIRSYWGYRDEITLQDGSIYKGAQVVIPQKMQKQMLAKVNASHQGSEASIRQVRDMIYWPGMTSEIRQMVGQCTVCNMFLQEQQKSH